MWKSKNSIVLTQVFTYVLAAVLLAATIGSYWLLQWYFNLQGRNMNLIVILIPFYLCVPIGFIALALILKLLKNIRREEVFVESNVNVIRAFSWCFIYVGIVCFVAGFFYLPFFIIDGASLFMAAIMRVLKNVMQAAVEVKNENDMTV